MTFSIKEQWDEGVVSEQVGKQSYIEVRNWLYSDNLTDTRIDGIAWIETNAPPSINSVLLSEIRVNARIIDNEFAEDAKQIWDVTLIYSQAREYPDLEPDGPVRMSVRSGTGASIPQLYSRGLIAEQSKSSEYSWEANADLKNLLGVQTDDSGETAATFTAKGIQKSAGATEVVIEAKFSHDADIEAFIVLMTEYATKQVINSVPYRSFGAGSLRFMNFDAIQDSGTYPDTDSNLQPWTFTYSFAHQPRVTGAELDANPPPGLTTNFANLPSGPSYDKRGWDYYDVTYINDSKNNAGATFNLPQAVRAAIHKMHEEIDFAAVLKI